MITQRTYESYQKYVERQGGKARRGRDFLLRHMEKKTGWFAREFRRVAVQLKPGAMLCLGARTGAENVGACRAGFIASVGLDLHPVGPTVVQGDWHEMPVADGAFANVYSNSLDHCYSLERLCAEVKRVLEPDGRFYVMASHPKKPVEKWLTTKGMEALYWDNSTDLRDAICDFGFTVTAEWRKGKWGHHIFAVTP